MEERCETCRFFGPGHSAVVGGFCRRRAPASNEWFPVTRPEQWCGEWEESEERVKAEINEQNKHATGRWLVGLVIDRLREASGLLQSNAFDNSIETIAANLDALIMELEGVLNDR
jgi:hypothetical protein